MTLKIPESAAAQVKNNMQNSASGTQAAIRQQISITGWANRLLADAAKRPCMRAVPRKEDLLSSPEIQAGRAAGSACLTSADGYRRHTPVQEIAVAPEYHRHLILRTVLCAAGTAVAILAICILIRLKLIVL